VAIRYELTGKGYNWVEGNCNLEEEQHTESTLVDDYISEALGF
jgi:hypothetical protein